MAPKRTFEGVKAKWMAQYKKKASFKKKPRAKRIKGGIAPREELKYVDTILTAANSVSTAFYTGSGVVTLLNGIAVGDDFTNRDGRQATMKSVQLRAAVYNITNGLVAGLVRSILVWDNAANGALPAVTDILATASTSSFPNVNNANRFTILRDHIVELGTIVTTATQTYAGSPTVQKVDLFVPLDDITQYSGTGATIASIQNGALLLLTIGENGAFQNGSMTARVRFSDD